MMLTRRDFAVGAGASAFIGGSAFGRELASASAAVAFAKTFKGELIAPASPSFERARRTFVINPLRQPIPRLIAFCSDEDDVRHAVSFAREQGWSLSVRSGGHDLMGASICDGLVIDLARLQTVDVDPSGTVRVGAGVRSAKLNAALAERSRAAVLGCSGQVGVAGLTLGGGLGWLVGTHGAACDHLVAARIVTADGRLLTVSDDQHPDLLWALRGGGGNFGVVTELTLRTHPAPQVITGTVAFRGDDIAGTLRRHRDFLASAGDHIDVEPAIFATPDGPVIFVKACCSADRATAEIELSRLRRLGTHLADDLAPRPYTGIIEPSGPVAALFKSLPQPRAQGDVPGLHIRSVSMAPVPDEAAEIVAERLAGARGGWAAGFAHYMHGAAVRVGQDQSPMPRVEGLLTTYFLSSWRRPEQAKPTMSWIDETAAALRPYARPTYLNYLTEAGPGEVRQAYGGAWARLRQVKARYDPGNIFRRNRNIVPS